jgi:hypothetical protein
MLIFNILRIYWAFASFFGIVCAVEMAGDSLTPRFVMTNVNRAVADVKEVGPQLRIVPAPNGASRKKNVSAPLRLLAMSRTRPPRAELAVLGWSHRAIRLAGRK